MKSKNVPINSARPFQIDELFFSTTNSKGIITSGNAVFTRVSGYPAEEMIGEPHNMIRHPDMPRAVFKLLWDYLRAGKSLAAYVKNLASDGCYYWVLALAAPTADGYLSVRFKPSSPLFAVVEEVYRELRAIELAHDERGEEPKAGMRAAEARLGELLQAKGFTDYDAFMRAVVYQELQSRDETLVRERRSLFPPLPAKHAEEGAQGTVLRSVYQTAQETYKEINALYVKLDQFARQNELISAQSRKILDLTSAFRFVSLNVAVKSSHLDDQGASLGVIATHLGEASTGVISIVTGLAAQVTAIANRFGETVFSLAWARLQFEMTTVYYHEMLTALAQQEAGSASAGQAIRLGNLANLRFVFRQTTEGAVKSLEALEKDLRGLGANTEDLRKSMLSLQVAHVAGLVEASRLTSDDGFRAIFGDIRAHIDDTKRELIEFNDVIGRLAAFARQTPEIMHMVAGAALRMKQDEESLTAAGARQTALAEGSVNSETPGEDVPTKRTMARKAVPLIRNGEVHSPTRNPVSPLRMGIRRKPALPVGKELDERFLPARSTSPGVHR